MFQQLETPVLEQEADNAPDLDIQPELMGAVNTAIRLAKQSGYSRDRIIERMNQCLADSSEKVTKRQLNAWTAASKEFHNMPARYIPAFCWATQCELPLKVLAQSLLLDLVDGRDQLVLQLGQNALQAAQISRQSRGIKTLLGNPQ